MSLKQHTDREHFIGDEYYQHVLVHFVKSKAIFLLLLYINTNWKADI